MPERVMMAMSTKTVVRFWMLRVVRPNSLKVPPLALGPFTSGVVSGVDSLMTMGAQDSINSTRSPEMTRVAPRSIT